MNKKQLKRFWKWFKNVRPWYFLAAFLVFSFISILALRANNLKMIELREAVYTADKDGGDIETALQNLRRHVNGHMNTDLSSGDTSVYPPIQLKYTYERLVRQAGERAATSNQDIYNAAQQHCERTIPSGFSGSGRIRCIEEYVAQHTSVRGPTNIPDALYKFDFASPSWSPDLAGFSLLFAALSLGWYLVVLLLNYLTRRALGVKAS